MKVFLSWSGVRSQKTASFLNEWLCCVVQACRPWISTRNIDRGSLWFGEINDQLKDTSVGIICLTKENKDAPWILFEAGALAKGLSTARVCPLLVDLEPKDVEDPLAQFNLTLPNKEGMKNLVITLNSSLGVSSLDSRVLDTVFETYWPQFEEKFANILEETKSSQAKEPVRSKEDLWSEILENTRTVNQRIRRLEKDIEYRPREAPEEMSIFLDALEMINDGAPLGYVFERFGPILGDHAKSVLERHSMRKKRKNL